MKKKEHEKKGHSLFVHNHTILPLFGYFHNNDVPK